jgi:Cu(I)/Ag(I) efflux system membrane protein CusA/SilA
VSLQGLPGVRVVRSSSAFGFSMINTIFEDGVDLYFARTLVLERLNLLAKTLPSGVVPTLGPDATGVGHVFWYTVEGKRYSLEELRSIQDWCIGYQLNAVPGVAEVASVGGVVRQYQIDVDPKCLQAFRISLSALRLVMSITILFTTPGGAPVVVVPWAAIQTIGANHVVFVPVEGEEGRFLQRTVQLGRLISESYTVEKGGVRMKRTMAMEEVG